MMGSYRLDDELGEGAVGLDMACFRVRIWAGAGWSLREDEGGTAVVKRGSSSSRRSLSLGAGGFFLFVGFLILPAFWGGMRVSWPWCATTWVR